MNTKTIVIKVGTSSITLNDGTLNQNTIQGLTKATTLLKQQGHRIIVVTSGAIGAGMSLLQCTKKPDLLSLKQAIAAVGQAKLIQTYQSYYHQQNQLCAQILLSNDILCETTKQENVRRTIETLHTLGVIPIVNENDTVSIAEIEHTVFSDNDTLSAIVATLLQADLLLLLSDVDGLYEKDGEVLTNKVLPYVDNIEQVTKHISSTSSSLGRGGMESKLRAINQATSSGIDTILTNIKYITELESIIIDHSKGTFFKGGENNDNKTTR